MIDSILYSRKNFEWTIFHVSLGLLSTISEWFLIIWFYLVIITSMNRIISGLLIRDSLNSIIPFIIYICSFEVFGRMIKCYPFLPWELSKYLIITISLVLIFSGKIIKPNITGILIFLFLIPALFIDKSNLVNFSELTINLLGPISMSLLLIMVGGNKIRDIDFNSLIRLLWFNCIPILVYTVIQTPEYSELEFSLSAGFETTGGFGSNQVATILGLGMFLSFYAWMNKLLFSGIHSLDGFFIGLFAYQGFLTFSRGGMVVGVLSILLYYIIFRSSKSFRVFSKTKSLRPLLFFVLALFILISTYTIIQNISDGNLALRYLGETQSTLTGQREKTINTITSGRYSIMVSDINLWLNNFIFGTGAGASRYLRDEIIYGYVAHTEFTRLLSEHGLFGIFIILLMFYPILKAFIIKQHSINRAILVVLGIIAIGTSMHSAMRTFVTPLLLALSSMDIVSDEEY